MVCLHSKKIYVIHPITMSKKQVTNSNCNAFLMSAWGYYKLLQNLCFQLITKLCQRIVPTLAKPLVRWEPFFPDISLLLSHKSQSSRKSWFSDFFLLPLDLVIYVQSFRLLFLYTLLCNSTASWQLLHDVEKKAPNSNALFRRWPENADACEGRFLS